MGLKKGPDGLPDGCFSRPNCYHIDQFESLGPVFMKVIGYCRAMGLDMIQGDHEDAPGQLELNFMFDDALRTADRLTTYRQICAQVRSEEHTSELQSLMRTSYAVFCLKKKTKPKELRLTPTADSGDKKQSETYKKMSQR